MLKRELVAAALISAWAVSLAAQGPDGVRGDIGSPQHIGPEGGQHAMDSGRRLHRRQSARSRAAQLRVPDPAVSGPGDAGLVRHRAVRRQREGASWTGDGAVRRGARPAAAQPARGSLQAEGAVRHQRNARDDHHPGTCRRPSRPADPQVGRRLRGGDGRGTRPQCRSPWCHASQCVPSVAAAEARSADEG